jgi:hypothetical protein
MDVSRALVFRWVAEGLIPIVILGYGPKGNRIVRIDERDLEKFMSERRNVVKPRRSSRLRLAAGAIAE